MKDKEVEWESEGAVTQLSALKRFYISARPRTCVSLSRTKNLPTLFILI